MPITAGKVTYSRTVQVRQFEPRHVAVEIAFEVDDQDKLQELINNACDVAKDVALDLVHQRER